MSGPHDTFDPIALHAWLADAGLAGVPMRDLLDGFCRRLVASGFPLTRGHASIAALHPLLSAAAVTWQGGRIVHAAEFMHEGGVAAAWLASPFHHMLQTRARRLHRRLAGDGAMLNFPVLRELRDAGLTEWLALIYAFGWTVENQEGGELGVAFSWATDGTMGWNAAELDALQAMSALLAVAIKASSSLGTTRGLLAAYLGADAAARVIAGHAQRGAVGRIAAFILYADLRGFTDFAETTQPEEVTRRLNGYFDCMGEPVRAAGGEILKFLGDGVLAVLLPGAGDEGSEVAAATLAAAHDILARVARLNEEEAAAGHPALAIDIALHQGEVTYGNVGTAERLDFTAIGPVVNEATRLEGLCKELGRHLLISDSFIRAAPSLRPQLRSLGMHRLRGVREPREVFTSEAARGGT